MPNAWEKLVEKLGEDGAREEMRRRAAKGPGNRTGNSYFKVLKEQDPEKLKEFGRKFGRKKNDDTTDSA